MHVIPEVALNSVEYIYIYMYINGPNLKLPTKSDDAKDEPIDQACDSPWGILFCRTAGVIGTLALQAPELPGSRGQSFPVELKAPAKGWVFNSIGVGNGVREHYNRNIINIYVL